ncbi:hypothetical protein Halru_0785 [Halovivax ruber XH-70]|uniref:Uncharacterized protein n=1 Tax=Halovivax ruber (strain DSM 18193 / JCM 13892 / XH-70) TaxID=797302 RepID=L0IB09_HALRX|nr:hypothetical protein [Halovivax ruber]AGB15411.1 hypothetical protein Halru_0785 [Halovivax ruber XH-70]
MVRKFTGRREMIRGLVAGSGFAGLSSGVSAVTRSNNIDWLNIEATYRITSNNRNTERGRVEEIIKAEVIHNGNNSIVIEVMDESGNHTARYDIPKSSTRPQLRGDRVERGNGEAYVEAETGMAPRVVRKVRDGWYTRFTVHNSSINEHRPGQQTDPNHSLDIELLEWSGGSIGDMNSPLVILPHAIPPNRRGRADARTTVEKSVSVGETDPTSTTQYAYSDLTTTDNPVAGIDTSKTDITCYATFDDGSYTNIDMIWNMTLASTGSGMR